MAYTRLKNDIAAVIKNNGNQDITGNVLQGTLIGMIDGLTEGYQYMGVATPSTSTTGITDERVFYIAGQTGTYSNMGGSAHASGIGIFLYNGSNWSYQNVPISAVLQTDANPTAGSTNPVQSGGTLNAILTNGSAFDLSAYNSGTTYANLTAALTAMNSLPAAYKKGGMTVKFVQSSDNNYVQCRLKAEEFSTDVDDWELYNDVTTSNHQGQGFDLEFSDEQNNVLVRFQNGDIRTKNFDSSKNASEEKRGLMSATDKSKLNGIEQGAEVNDVIIDDVEGADLTFSDERGNVLIQAKGGHIRTKNFDSSKISKYYPYQRRTAFTVLDDTINYLYTNFTAVNIDTIDTPVLYSDNCVLYLPDSYSNNGKPTRLAIYCKHGGALIKPTLDSDDLLTKNSTKYIYHYLLHQGYAILAVDGVPDGWRDSLKIDERYAVGNYVAVQSTIKAYHYVTEHYNITKEDVSLFGFSMGGLTVLNLIENSNLPIGCAALISPVVSMRYQLWDNRSTTPFVVDGESYNYRSRYNIAKIFDFPFSDSEDLDELIYDYQKTTGYDSWFKNVENMYDGFTQTSPYGANLYALPNGTTLNDITMKKWLRCPVKVWVADNDETLGADVTKVFVKSLKNAGVACDIQVYSSGGHHIESLQTPLGTYTEHGEQCTLTPMAKDVADWFYINNGD